MGSGFLSPKPASGIPAGVGSTSVRSFSLESMALPVVEAEVAVQVEAGLGEGSIWDKRCSAATKSAL